MYSSTGNLAYSTDGGHRIVLDVDEELAAYYRSLIPPWMRVNKPRYLPHITVVRIHKETPNDLAAWGKHAGEAVEFLYEPHVYYDSLYYWLNIWCVRLEEIREELGMSVTSPYTVPPDGFHKCFHCTIANKKLL